MKEVIQLNTDGTFVRAYESANEAEQICSINQSNILRVCRGKAKTSGGYMWAYKEDYEKGKVKIELLIPSEDFPSILKLLGGEEDGAQN